MRLWPVFLVALLCLLGGSTLLASPPSAPLLSVTEYLEVTFKYDGSYQVDRVWGLIVLKNPTSDVISSIRIWYDQGKFKVKMVRPFSSDWLPSPLKLNQLMPGEEVVWYYEALDPSNYSPPLRVEETVTPTNFVRRERTRFKLTVRLIPNGTLREVSFSKSLPWLSDVVVSQGSFDGGVFTWNASVLSSPVTLTVEGLAEINACLLPAARITFRAEGASIRLKAHGTTSAQVGVIKSRDGGWQVGATFKNSARGVKVNLTEVCLYDEVNGRLVRCFHPNRVIEPGEVWASPIVSDSPESIPKYFATANFTVIFDQEYFTAPSSGNPPTVEAPVVEPPITCHEREELIQELSFRKSMSPKVVKPGDVVTISLSVSNEGNITAHEVLVVDPLPEGLSYLSGPEELREGQYWNFGEVKPGETKTISFKARVVAEEPGVITNRVYYQGREVASDSIKVVVKAKGPAPTTGGPTQENVTSTTALPTLGVTGVPRIVASKAASPTVVKVGETITFTIRVRNEGNASAKDVRVTDSLPAYLLLVRGTESGRGATFMGGLTWVIEKLEPGQEAVITFSAVVKGYPEGGVGENIAYVNGKPYRATFRVEIPEKEASLTKSGFVIAKGVIKFIITVSSPTGVTTKLIDILPPIGQPLGMSSRGGKLEWTVVVPRKGTTVVEFKMKVPKDFTGQITNVASLPEFNKASGVTLLLHKGLAAPEVESIMKVAVPPAVLLPLMVLLFPVLLRRRYRKYVVMDYESLRGILLNVGVTGLRDLGRAVISDLTLMRSMEDPIVSLVVAQAINEGVLDVVPLDDVSSLFLLMEAPESELDAEKMSSIILARNFGAKIYTISLKAELVASSYGVDVVR